MNNNSEMNRPMPDSFCHQGMCIPNHMIEGLQRYIRNRIHPGDFLSAVINNNLRRAAERADDINARIITAYVAYLYNHAPSNSWGYAGALDKWINTKEAKQNEQE